MKLSKYLADYIEHEKYDFASTDTSYGSIILKIDINDLQKVIQQGIEAFVSTEIVRVYVYKGSELIEHYA